jgi:hypothetical protein
MDGRDDLGSQYDFLTGKGVDIRLKSGPGLLHHKYAIIDGDWGPTWQLENHPTVITGSHNWTNSAENTNNENTLIIEDDTVSLMYLQEFTARYYQFGGTDSIKVDVRADATGLPETMALMQNYPNPFNPNSDIRYQISEFRNVRLAVYDLLGREVALLVNEMKPAGMYEVRFDASGLASGVYLYRLTAGAFVETRKMIVLR